MKIKDAADLEMFADSLRERKLHRVNVAMAVHVKDFESFLAPLPPQDPRRDEFLNGFVYTTRAGILFEIMGGVDYADPEDYIDSAIKPYGTLPFSWP